MKIYKYSINSLDVILQIPGEINYHLDTQIQDGYICSWFLVDEKEPYQSVRIVRYGTGWDMPEDAYLTHLHLATVQDSAGYVWHLFRVTED